MGESEWEAEKKFASELVAALYYALDSLHVGTIVNSENSTATHLLPLKRIDDIVGVRNAIETLDYIQSLENEYKSFGSSLGSALHDARTDCFTTNEDRHGINNLVFIATRSRPLDVGIFNLDYTKDMTYHAADLLRKEGATIIAVGVPNDQDPEFIKRISSKGKDRNYYQAASFSEMSDFIQPIVMKALDFAAGKMFSHLITE